MSTPIRAGILGGTFDPIHIGHVETASAVGRMLSLDYVMLLPSRTPPHRNIEPRASGYHRFAMTALAASEREELRASDIELRRDGPSYTVHTLESLHGDGFAAAQLYFIVGADAFAEIDTWYDYPRLLELANFVVVPRPGFPAPAAPPPHRGPTTVRCLDISTPDVSSTEIRQRVARGEPIADLVTRGVAEHIRRHQLYVPVPAAARL
jgi:nicotinate-nucleotide adenylyltransferase